MSNIAYYQRRELEEIELATIANDPRARRVHEGLARKCARLARQEPAKRVASFELTAQPRRMTP